MVTVRFPDFPVVVEDEDLPKRISEEHIAEVAIRLPSYARAWLGAGRDPWTAEEVLALTVRLAEDDDHSETVDGGYIVLRGSIMGLHPTGISNDLLTFQLGERDHQLENGGVIYPYPVDGGYVPVLLVVPDLRSEVAVRAAGRLGTLMRHRDGIHAEAKRRIDEKEGSQ